MKNYIFALFLLILSILSSAQEISSIHQIEKINGTNEYTIKTTVSGLDGVDLAKVEYQIPDKHTYKASPKNTFFADRKENMLKFYIMAVPTNGIIEIEFSLVINETSDVNFPVLFQYSKSEEKNKINLTPITIKTEQVANLTETPIIERPADLDENKEEQKTETIEEETINNATINNITSEETEAAEEKQEEQKEEVVKEKVVKDEVKKNIETTNETVAETSKTAGKYGVQLFALAEYSQVKVFTYCRKYNLDTKQITIKEMNGLTKVWYGKLDSATAAQQLKQELINKGITGVFVIKHL